MEPELDLEQAEKAYLVSLVSMHGYKVLHKVIKSECDRFIVAHLNTAPDDTKKILASFIMTKTAAMLYTAWTNRVNSIVEEYTHTPKASDAPIDITAGVLDIGDEILMEEFDRSVLYTHDDVLEER
jgi:hypothetical protein